MMLKHLLPHAWLCADVGVVSREPSAGLRRMLPDDVSLASRDVMSTLR